MNMMTGSTDMKQLKRKYSSFSAPSAEVIVDGIKLVAAERMKLQELTVDLTSGYEASGCEFVIGDCYEDVKTDFKKAINSRIQIGAKVEIIVGYIRTESVFTGYINEISYLFGMNGVTGISVSCIDAKGLLMKNRRLEAFKEKKADGVIRSLLGEQPVSDYLTGREIDDCKEEEIPLRTGMKTDYEVITQQAGKMGYEFFIIQGKAYFRRAEKVSTPIMTLEPGHGVKDAAITYSGAKLTEQVEVRSINEENGEMISGKAKLNGKFSSGMSAERTYRSTIQVFYEAGVESVAEATSRAETRVQSMEAHFGSLELSCVGIPELVPGRFIKLDRFSSMVNGNYYITGVRHSITDDGYETVVKGRRSSL